MAEFLSSLTTPQEAAEKIRNLGYDGWTAVPLGQSDYLDALVATAKMMVVA